MKRILQVSDLHLSAALPVFEKNWEAVQEHIQKSEPDLVVFSGDLVFEAPLRPSDLEFVARKLEGLSAPYEILPGNHDIGENPCYAGGYPLNTDLQAAWMQAFGRDHFSRSLGDWQIAGINTQIIGTAQPGDADQFADFAALDRQKPTLIFGHLPLFVAGNREEATGKFCLSGAASQKLMGLLETFDQLAYGSGHLHRFATSIDGPIAQISCPSTAFLVYPEDQETVPGDPQLGFLMWHVSDDGTNEYEVEAIFDLPVRQDLSEFVTPQGFDSQGVLGRYGI